MLDKASTKGRAHPEALQWPLSVSMPKRSFSISASAVDLDHVGLPRTTKSSAPFECEAHREEEVRQVLAALVVSAVALMAAPATSGNTPAVQPDESGALFVLGEEDGSRSGYKGYGWSGVDEHKCTVLVDCHTKPFPSHLHAASAKPTWESSAVISASITFGLDRTYTNVTLRLVRAGAETIAVRLDGGQEALVTKAMMQPETYEHSGFGAYDLDLGSLDAGTHVLELSVEDDGEGNGRFGWDAIILRTAAN